MLSRNTLFWRACWYCQESFYFPGSCSSVLEHKLNGSTVLFSDCSHRFQYCCSIKYGYKQSFASPKVDIYHAVGKSCKSSRHLRNGAFLQLKLLAKKVHFCSIAEEFLIKNEGMSILPFHPRKIEGPSFSCWKSLSFFHQNLKCNCKLPIHSSREF